MSEYPSEEIEEDQNWGIEKIMDWLCWKWASTAEENYPPEDRAQKCIDEWKEDKDVELSEEDIGLEKGEHNRMFLSAVSNFIDLKEMGYDPKARAKRFIEYTRKDGMGVDDIDWTWWDNPSDEDDK